MAGRRSCAPANVRPSRRAIPTAIINRSGRDAVVLEIGNSDPKHDRCVYADIDMVAEPGLPHYSHRDGTPYPVNEG